MKRTKRGVVLLSLAFTMLVVSGPTAALAAGRSSNQQDPALAYNTQREEYLLVWSDDLGRQGSDIWGRRLFTSGLPQGGAHRTSGRFQIAAGAGNQDQPAIAYNTQRDEYLVVWSDDRNPDTGWDIYAQRLFTSGLPVGRSIAIHVGPGNQTHPAITYNPLRDEYLVVWDDDRDGDKGWDIYGQRVETNGLWTTGRDFLIATGGSNQREPAVAFNGERYLLLWTDDRGDSLDIRGKRVFASGLPIGGAGGYEFGVAGGPSNETAAALPTTNAGLLVWSGDANIELKGMDLFGIRLFESGLPSGRGYGISVPEANQVSPALAYNPDRGEYLVVWSDDRKSDNFDLYALRLSPPGLPVGRDFPVFTDN